MWIAQAPDLKFKRNRSEMFLKIGAFKDFAMFTGKQLCWSLFWVKLQVKASI